MQILKLTKQNHDEVVNAAIMALKNQGTVVYPTETCYGIGVDATDQNAVDKLMKYKARREGKPLSVAVSDKEMASKYVELNDIAENLYDNYLPGPITVVSKGLHKVANGVESEFGTLGIRIPDYQLVLDIVKKYDKPITSTSANVSYKPRPYSIEELLSHLPGKQKKLLDLVIDAGELPRNPSSTVVDTTLNNLNIMREGSLKFDTDIADDKVVLKAETSTAEQTQDFGSLVMLKYIDHMVNRPLIFALRGELGAGKTQFVKGLARSLKIKDTVSSPTFTLIDEYDYNLADKKGMLIHADTWRIASAEEFRRSGFEVYLKDLNVLAIEWADKFYDELLEMIQKEDGYLVKVDFSYKSESERRIKVYDENEK